MVGSIPLFLQRCSGLARAFAGTCIGTGTLASHGQTTAMTETTVASNVHQALDVHGGFTAQIAFNGEMRDLVAYFLQIAIRQILDLLGVSDATRFANFASARTTNSKNRCQPDFRMLLRRGC